MIGIDAVMWRLMLRLQQVKVVEVEYSAALCCTILLVPRAHVSPCQWVVCQRNSLTVWRMRYTLPQGLSDDCYHNEASKHEVEIMHYSVYVVFMISRLLL